MTKSKAPFSTPVFVLRCLGWLSVATIALLSLVPGSVRPHVLATGQLEHFVAYAGTATLLAAGYTAKEQLIGIQYYYRLRSVSGNTSNLYTWAECPNNRCGGGHHWFLDWNCSYDVGTLLVQGTESCCRLIDSKSNTAPAMCRRCLHLSVNRSGARMLRSRYHH